MAYAVPASNAVDTNAEDGAEAGGAEAEAATEAAEAAQQRPQNHDVDAHAAWFGRVPDGAPSPVAATAVPAPQPDAPAAPGAGGPPGQPGDVPRIAFSSDAATLALGGTWATRRT